MSMFLFYFVTVTMEMDSVDSEQTAKKRRLEELTPDDNKAAKNVISFNAFNTKLLSNIFSMVELKDLAALGSSNKRFNQIARKVFSEKFQDGLFEIRANQPLIIVAGILRCFNNQITKLAICYGVNSNVNVKIDVLVDKYCRQVLTEIQFSDVGLYSSTRAFIFPFRNVTHLMIRSGLLSGKLVDIATQFPNVTHIHFCESVQPGGAK